MINYAKIVSSLLSGLVGGRCYPCVSGQGTTPPYLIYEYKVKGNYTKDGCYEDNITASIACYDKSMQGSIELAEQVREKMERQTDAEVELIDTEMGYDDNAELNAFVLKFNILTD